MHPAISSVHSSLDAQVRSAQSRLRLLELLDGEETLLNQALKAFSRARVAVHFHPDRLTRGGRTVAQGLLADGWYRSQFETGHSNGSLTAFSGGARDVWEDRLFFGAYHGATKETERPKYGADDLFPFSDGPAPRFGSCYLVLRPEASGRCSFCVGDSYVGPDRVGTARRPEDLLLGLMERCLTEETVMGQVLAPRELALHLAVAWRTDRSSPSTLPVGRSLDDYVEAQVHGPLSLEADVDSLVADSSFQGQPTGEDLEKIAERYGFPMAWRPTFELALKGVPDDFRGPVMPDLARRITPRGEPLTARVIGEGALSLEQARETWNDWPSNYDETWQQLKQLWHVLVAFGSPSNSWSVPEDRDF